VVTVRFAIRAYRPEDFRRLWEIDQSCFPPGISYSQFELKTYIRHPSSFTLVAEQTGSDQSAVQGKEEKTQTAEVLGFLVANRAASGRGHIITIDVRESGRRFGIGSALLNSAEEQFRAAHCAVVRLETAVDNVAALSFYKRHGYTVIKSIPRYYSNGVDALLLEKDLHSPLSSR
jgi:[ribosomal protein S18]-alanine N-acetyltransferase